MTQDNLQKKNRKVVIAISVAFLLMTGLSFASVPLYRIFCSVTGFGGTTQTADSFPEEMSERVVTVNFNADISSELPWSFAPETRAMKVRLGQKGLIAYNARNLSAEPIVGTAVYNVVPLKAGKYFHKVQCFCFGEQLLAPGKSAKMPVMFYIDPEMDDDPALDDVKVVTLSYTFYKSETKALDEAVEAFYN